MKEEVAPINVVIVGAGHYSTGTTVLTGHRSTDKDLGVFLPSALMLQAEGIVGRVTLIGTDGSRLSEIRRSWTARAETVGLLGQFECSPEPSVTNPTAYLEVLRDMPKPCAALIAVPDHLHGDVIKACIEAGVHFLVVKPAVTKLSELYGILEAIEKSPVFGMVDYHKVFDEANVLIKHELTQGSYGRVQHVMSLMTQRRDMVDIYSRWLKSANPPNINHYLGSHYIHLVRYMTEAEPIDVRATAQFGVANRMLDNENTADLIETQVRWRAPEGSLFSSYHVAGWSDPSETESMTYQEIHLICDKGHVDSDQRYRGLSKVIAGEGQSVVNPYFFNLIKNPQGKLAFNTKYGFLSVRAFVESCSALVEGRATAQQFDAVLPTIRESAAVTAILEASDMSLASDSSVISIRKSGTRYHLES